MLSTNLTILTDYLEEGWESMDLCAQMLIKHLPHINSDSLETTAVCPSFVRRFQNIPYLKHKRVAFNGDRLLNRFFDYPLYLNAQCNGQSNRYFHIVDHTYAQLTHNLPANRTGVFCHDIDAFRSMVEPDIEPRPQWFRLMSSRILNGMQKAAVVFYSTDIVRQQIEQYQLVDSKRLVKAPYGTSPEFVAQQPVYNVPVRKEAQAVLCKLEGKSYLLHVGSCIPRKRIDILLDVFAGVRHDFPDLKLVKVGGDWTEGQWQQIRQFNLAEHIFHFKGLERSTLAELYRNAALVLQPSESEGFGLPVIEALACGAIVVASDIPALKEVGCQSAVFCPVAQVPVWVDTVCQLLKNPGQAPDIRTRLDHVSQYTWSAHAKTIAKTYMNLSLSHRLG